MKNKQLYKIRQFGGSYDDSWESVDYVTDDFEKGTAYVNNKNSFAQVMMEAEQKCSEYLALWQQENPRPNVRDLKQVKIPSFPNKVKPTKEMLEERENLKKKNKEDYEDAYRELKEWGESRIKAQNNFQSQFSEEIQKGFHDFSYIDVTWVIEPVAWLE